MYRQRLLLNVGGLSTPPLVSTKSTQHPSLGLSFSPLRTDVICACPLAPSLQQFSTNFAFSSRNKLHRSKRGKLSITYPPPLKPKPKRRPRASATHTCSHAAEEVLE